MHVIYAISLYYRASVQKSHPYDIYFQKWYYITLESPRSNLFDWRLQRLSTSPKLKHTDLMEKVITGVSDDKA